MGLEKGLEKWFDRPVGGLYNLMSSANPPPISQPTWFAD